MVEGWVAEASTLRSRLLRHRHQVFGGFGSFGEDLGIEVLLLEFAAPAFDFEFVEDFADDAAQQAFDAAFPAADVVASGADSVSSFAWQAGGGLLFDLSERVTFDLGYRFFSIGAGSTSVTVMQSGVPLETAGVSSAFSASELLLTVRIYEPFRGWR